MDLQKKLKENLQKLLEKIEEKDDINFNTFNIIDEYLKDINEELDNLDLVNKIDINNLNISDLEQIDNFNKDKNFAKKYYPLFYYLYLNYNE